MNGLSAAIESVVADDNCSGCGGCALISSRVSMTLSADGYARPVVATGGEEADEREQVRQFRESCPGVRVSAPSRIGLRSHPILGSYLSAWEAWAVDPEVRFAGSSGGVLTALTAWLVQSGQAKSVVGAAPGHARPSTTVPVRITTRDEALASSGSRYGPVGVAQLAGLSRGDAIVGKPCEASAIRQLVEARGQDEAPLVLSFFCAGTPSQHATDRLVAQLGAPLDDLAGLRYRGNGWPGAFTATTNDGQTFSTSYEQSWGEHLGHDLQWRCKVCVDGTGGHADVAVGDYWAADANGFPVFENQDGRSVALARTQRGHDLLLEAARDGVIELRDIDIDAVAAVQPLQVERKRMLAARLIGRRLAGRRIPRYRGYGLAALAWRFPIRSLRSLVGTFRRSLRRRRA